MMSRNLLLAVVAEFGVVAGCGGDVKLVTPPLPPETRYTLTVLPDAGDQAVAQALGWTNGIPGAEVTLTDTAGANPRQFTTTAAGTIGIPALASGLYIVNIRRVFSAQETAKLATGDDALAFVGKGVIQPSPTLLTETVRIPASRKRGVLFSEWSGMSKLVPGVGSYIYGGFIELYNNSDTTIFLDGMVIAEAFSVNYDYTNFPCSMFETLRNDPAGIWAIYMEAFPGTGRQYAIAPGQLKVIATDAIDHSQFSSGLLDLRSADFEFTGIGDVDNPGVPNMISVGTETALGGHGLDLYDPLGSVGVLVAPFDLAAQPRQKDPRNARVYVRLPPERIRDVFVTRSNFVSTFSPCREMVHKNFDREEGVLLRTGEGGYLFSASRKALGSVSGVRTVLQSTRSSAVDFFTGQRSPGRL